MSQAYILKWLEVDKQVLERWLNREKGYTLKWLSRKQSSVDEDSMAMSKQATGNRVGE